MFENGHVLDKYADEESEWEDETPLLLLGGLAVISQVAVGLKKGLELSMQDASDREGNMCTKGEQQERFNNWTRKLSELQKDPRIDRKRMKELDRGLDDLIAKLYETVLSRRRVG